MNELADLSVKSEETNDILEDILRIITQSKEVVYKAIDIALLKRNWLIGKRIHDEELKETRKENYGLEIIKTLAKELLNLYGNGFSKSNLYNFHRFYKEYKNIFQTVSGKCNNLLSWSHYLLLLNVFDSKARKWYENEAIKLSWSVRTLQRNICS